MKKSAIVILSIIGMSHLGMSQSKTSEIIGLEIGNKAPEMKFADPNGKFIALSSLEGKMVLIDFWASWCGPCRMMAPAFTKAAAILEPQMRLVKVNTEEEQNLAARYHIRSIPTLAIFKGGQEIARQSGAMSEQDLVRWAQTISNSQ